MNDYSHGPIYNGLIYLTYLITLLPLILLLVVRNNTTAPKNLRRALLLLCVISIFSDLIGVIAGPIFKNNNPIYHVYDILSGAVILHIYKLNFTNEKTKKIIILLLFVYVTFSIFLFFYKDGYKFDNTKSLISLKIIVILLSIYYFLTLFYELKIRSLKSYYFFWINAAFLFYSSTTFYVFLFEDFMMLVTNEIYLWPIHLIATIIFNLLLSKGIWTMKKLS
jgi:hypothetical protein